MKVLNQFNSQNVKIGDELIRMVGGTLPMKIVVGNIDEEFLFCGSKDGVIPWEVGWKFRKDNGAEVDEELGWDGINETGSFLKNKK